MRKSLFFLPTDIQRTLHRFESQKWKVPMLYLTSLYLDTLGYKKVFYADNIFFSDNPLITIAFILSKPDVKSFIVVPEPDLSKTTNFPYNMLELADLRYFVEKMIFKEETGEIPKHEGFYLWWERIYTKFQHEIDLRGQKLYFINGFHKFAGQKRLEANFLEYKFVYLTKQKEDDKSLLSLDSRQIKTYLWRELTNLNKSYDMPFFGDEVVSESVLWGNHIINPIRDINDAVFDVENIRDWFTSTIDDLRDLGYIKSSDEGVGV